MEVSSELHVLVSLRKNPLDGRLVGLKNHSRPEKSLACARNQTAVL
jgi:hypothetical protein